MAQRYKTQDFIDAIPNTGGIISAIAKRVGCNWETARDFIDAHPTVKAAFDAERESLLDLSENVLQRNIQLALRAQEPTQTVDDAGKVVMLYPPPTDTSDAKWLLSKRGKKRGYGDVLDVTGAVAFSQDTSRFDAALAKVYGAPAEPVTPTPNIEA